MDLTEEDDEPVRVGLKDSEETSKDSSNVQEETAEHLGDKTQTVESSSDTDVSDAEANTRIIMNVLKNVGPVKTGKENLATTSGTSLDDGKSLRTSPSDGISRKADKDEVIRVSVNTSSDKEASEGVVKTLITWRILRIQVQSLNPKMKMQRCFLLLYFAERSKNLCMWVLMRIVRTLLTMIGLILVTQIEGGPILKALKRVQIRVTDTNPVTNINQRRIVIVKAVADTSLVTDISHRSGIVIVVAVASTSPGMAMTHGGRVLVTDLHTYPVTMDMIQREIATVRVAGGTDPGGIATTARTVAGTSPVLPLSLKEMGLVTAVGVMWNWWGL